MARHSHLAPCAAHDAVSIDEKSRAVDPHILASVHALFDPGTVFLADIRARIGCQRKGEIVLFLELVMRGDGIFRDPDDHRICPAIIGKDVAEPARFGGAAGGIVLGVEIEDHLFAVELRQRDSAVAVGGQREVRGFVADFDTHRAPSPLSVAARRARLSISRSYQLRTCAAASVISESNRAESTVPTHRARVSPSDAARSMVAGRPSLSKVSTVCTL